MITKVRLVKTDELVPIILDPTSTGGEDENRPKWHHIVFRLLFDPHTHIASLQYVNELGALVERQIPVKRLYPMLSRAEEWHKRIEEENDFVIKDFFYDELNLYSGEIRIDISLWDGFMYDAKHQMYSIDDFKPKNIISFLINWIRRPEPPTNPYATEEIRIF